MTDAALSVTQSAVETFTELYIVSLGGTVEKDGQEWKVTIPADAPTDLPIGGLTLVCDPREELAENETALHPESSFFLDVLEEASTQAPLGSVEIAGDSVGIDVPQWLQKSPVSVSAVQFVPYYDRSAVVVIFRVSIETVSEYQRELLRAIAVDTRTQDILPLLGETFLESTEPGNDIQETTASSPPERSDLEELVDVAREHLVETIQKTVDEVHREASRAADAELEEYRQMQQQREQELQDELANLQSRIDEVSSVIDEGSQGDRVQALKERKELKTAYEECNAELTDLHQRRDNGFPERQREIRERHAVTVVITPLTISHVEYERGEIEFELIEDSTQQTLTTGYGSGVGVTEDVVCDVCNRALSGENPLATIKTGTRCTNCRER